MNTNSSGSPIDRVMAWLRGFFAAGKSATGTATRDVRRAAHDTANTVRADVDDAGQRIRDLTERRDRGDTASTARSSSAPTDDEVAARSDFDDAAGDWETGAETYPSGRSDLGSATHVHDAVGGEDERADDATDGTIDTTRDADLTPGGTEGYQDREIPLQDELIVSEGASSDEFDGDEITVGGTDTRYVSPADVESAAIGYGDTTNTDLSNTSDKGTSTLTGSTYTETDVTVPPAEPGAANRDGASGAGTSGQQNQTGGQHDSFHVVERYNYAMGDFGVGAGTAPDDAWNDDTGPDVTTSDLDATGGTAAGADAPTGQAGGTPGDVDASVSPDATRTEIESQSRGDAVNKSDEATQTPGFGAPETFDEPETGTTKPSRSATGDELDEEQDALGTTLDYSEESDDFDEDEANLSGEDELAVSDDDIDFGFEQGSVERVATFQSGTIAQEGLIDTEPAIDEEVTDEAYAELPDEPRHETADDAGLDDFSGSDYPSDRIVDTLTGDDFADAEEPDVTDLDSSAGDLSAPSTDAAEQVDYVTEPVARTVGDAGSHLDQDLVGTSDEHVGGEEPESAETASRGTDETSFDDLSTGAQAVDETLAGAEGVPADAGASDSFAVDDVTGSGDLGAGAEGTTDTRAEPEVGGMGVIDGDVTGDETSHVAPGEVAFDERLGGDQNVASQTPTGVVTAADAGDEAEGTPDEYPPAGAAGETTGTVDAESETAARGDAGTASDIPTGAVRGDGTTSTPDGFPVKGNASSMIYHLPSFPSYKTTKAEYCFATEQDAINAGYRAPGKRNRGKKS